MISDTPGRGGGGGVKKGQILADVLYGWPLRRFLMLSKLLHNLSDLAIDETASSKNNFLSELFIVNTKILHHFLKIWHTMYSSAISNYLIQLCNAA